MDNLISARKLDLVIVDKKKKTTCPIVDFSVSVDHRVKIKDSEKRDKYQELARELSNVKVISIVVGEL